MRKIKSIFLIFLIFFELCLFAEAQTLQGKIKHDNKLDSKNKVVNSQTQEPISGAKVSIPTLGYSTTTDNQGEFEFSNQISGKNILSIEKEGYRPFSLTIDKNMMQNPLKLGLQEAGAGDITIESSVCHLGDDVYSNTSANSSEFRGKSVGAFFSKKFSANQVKPNEQAILIIGSVIGLDTKLAKELGQNKIASVYSSPTEIYFNNHKIGELKLNGDNQEILIPPQLLKNSNEITIKTGRNLFQHAYLDLDDIEITSIRLEIRNSGQTFAKR